MKARIQKLIFGLCVLPLAQAGAAPVGFSVNSDEPNGDSLYQIDLATGQETLVGPVLLQGINLKDIEGLAIDRNGQLWGVDDESLRLVAIDSVTAVAPQGTSADINGLGAVQGNDFGLTFTCDNELYVSSVADQVLYRLAPDGTATPVGNLGERISALASWGKPARLYGLGNGLVNEGGPVDNRSLFEIDPQNGATTLIGKLGSEADDYFQAGLAFDAGGELWAITDRWTLAQPLGSEVHRLNLSTGKASLQSTTTIAGFESLAIAPPGGCAGPPPTDGPAFPFFEGIPTLDAWGKVLAFLALSMVGLSALHRRSRLSR